MRQRGAKRLRRERAGRIRRVAWAALGLAGVCLLPTLLLAIGLTNGGFSLALAVIWDRAAARAVVVDNCCDGCGKWNAAQAQMSWHGNEGFLSTVGCDDHTCVYGGVKYLQKRVFVKLVYTEDDYRWGWNGTAWELDQGHADYHGLNDNTTTINRRSGCKAAVGEYSPGALVTSGSLFNCTGDDYASLGYVAPYDCVVGGGLHHEKPLDHWGTLDYRCGAFTGVFDGCANTYFGGGSAADLKATLGDGIGGVIVTVDPVTDTHIGFVAVSDFSYAGSGHASPPDRDGTVFGEVVCAGTEFHMRIEVKIDLSIAYSYADLQGEAYELLSNYNLRLTPFKDMPTCSGGGWHAGPDSQDIVLLTRKDTGCCSSGMADLGAVCDPTLDGSVVQGWVRGATYEHPLNLTWGAFERFDALDISGVITVQKWAMRQGKYQPWDWSVEGPKLWTYLYLNGTADFCSGAAAFHCQNFVGFDGKVFCISPNGDFGPYPNTLWQDGYVFVPERLYGNDWQGAVKDADRDTYPTCYPAPPPGEGEEIAYVEPKSCDCNCPDGTACGLPGAAVCPFEPEDNWP